MVVGPVTVRLHDELVLGPDVVFIHRARVADVVDLEGAIHGPPDLVVEVLSPGNREYDRTLKRKRYLENGVPELWVLDADQETVEVWRAGPDEPARPSGTVGWEAGGEHFQVPIDEFFD